MSNEPEEQEEMQASAETGETSGLGSEDSLVTADAGDRYAKIKGICEAVIFAADKPVSFQQLKGIFDDEPGIDAKVLKEVLAAMREELAAAENRGLTLVETAGGFAFRTKPEHRFWVARLTTPKAVRLSRASLETLAIVAYRQPVTRAGIDDIRGVDSGAVLKGLLEKKLVKILGRTEAVGNPLIYGTTKEFLEAFGLKDLAELPTLKEFQELDADSRRALDAHGVVLDEPPTDEAVAASEQQGVEATAETLAETEGIERTGQRVKLTDARASRGETEDGGSAPVPPPSRRTSADEASDE